MLNNICRGLYKGIGHAMDCMFDVLEECFPRYKPLEKNKKELTWGDLGVPETVVREHEDGPYIKLEEPPKEVRERLIEKLYWGD